METLLYGLLFVPGLLYSGYRLANLRKVCPKCGASEFVGTDTPRGLAILARVECAGVPTAPVDPAAAGS